MDSVKPVTAIKRCPQCHELALEFDIKQGRIFCARCGFEESVPRMR